MELDDLDFLGSGLNRPECVLAHVSGKLFVPDWTEGGGVAVVEPDGRVRRILAPMSASPLRPNGIALLPGGRFLLAHLGPETGGLFELASDGSVRPILTELDGRPLPPSNFVFRDAEERLWLTISTRRVPRALGYRPSVADGFILLLDRKGARLVADGLGYTNECIVHPDGRRLFVNETFARRLIAFDIGADGALGNKTCIATFGPGTFPDGLSFDRDGNVWITSIVSNRVIRVAPNGEQHVVLQDCPTEHLEDVERAFQAGTMGRPHLDRAAGRRLANISSLAFGGADLKTVYLGCLLGDRVAVGRVDVPGHPLPHWTCPLGPLA
jgi:sugar lactone lactonase YvrE